MPEPNDSLDRAGVPATDSVRERGESWRTVIRGWEQILCNHVGMWEYYNEDDRECCNCGERQKRSQGSRISEAATKSSDGGSKEKG